MLFKTLFPSWFAAFAFSAIAIGALVPAAVMSIGAANLFHPRNVWKSYVDPTISHAGEADGGENHLAGRENRRRSPSRCCCRCNTRSICNCWGIGFCDLPGAGVRPVHALVPAKRCCSLAVGIGWGSWTVEQCLKPLATIASVMRAIHFMFGSAR